jgi:hypothetical protein
MVVPRHAFQSSVVNSDVSFPTIALRKLNDGQIGVYPIQTNAPALGLWVATVVFVTPKLSHPEAGLPTWYPRPFDQRVDLLIALSAPPPAAYMLSTLTNMLNGQRQGEKQRKNSGLALPGSSPFVSATMYSKVLF